MSKTAKQAIRKHILSPASVHFGDVLAKTRAETSARLLDEIRRNEDLLKPDGGMDVANPEAQRGRVLGRAAFCRKVTAICPKVWYEQSIRYPDKGAFYIDDPRSPYGKRMVAAFPHDVIFEFDVRLTVPSLIPDPHIALHWRKIQAVDSKRPGWRSVLLRLLMEGLLTATDADREFNISAGRSSQKWQQATA